MILLNFLLSYTQLHCPSLLVIKGVTQFNCTLHFVYENFCARVEIVQIVQKQANFGHVIHVLYDRMTWKCDKIQNSYKKHKKIKSTFLFTYENYALQVIYELNLSFEYTFLLVFICQRNIVCNFKDKRIAETNELGPVIYLLGAYDLEKFREALAT